MSEASGSGPYDDRLEQRLAELKAGYPGIPDLHFRISLVKELRKRTPLTLSAARDQVDAFIQRRGIQVPPDPPSLVLHAILLLGALAAVFVAPVFSLSVGGLLVLSGHTDLAARYWPALLAGSGVCVWAVVMLWCGPPLWRSYRQSVQARASKCELL